MTTAACRTMLRVVAGLLLVVMAGCASLPAVGPRAAPSYARSASDDTALGRIAGASSPAPGLSGFRLLPLGTFSLDARVELSRRAQATLDLQYYHFASDRTGLWLLRALRDAAGRGVRVRLLIDDLYTGGADSLFLSFAAHRNVEVRLFNPFVVARGRGPVGRFLAAPFDWTRINHRMHNKLFIADGAMAVLGGRNIADEYYLRRDSDNFIDVDALAVGAVLPELQSLFDMYWNSANVFALGTLAASPLNAVQLQRQFELATNAETTPPPSPLPASDVLGRPAIGGELDRGALALHWGPARAFADDPDKPMAGRAGGALAPTSVTHNVYEAMRGATHSVMASSPYFIPGKAGMELIAGLRQRGVAVSVLTNSLASTDEPLVHLGYVRYREALLDLGVELHELSHLRLKENMRMFLYGARLGRLHAKTVVIDGRTSFVGSMNLDPRSATLNTELGVFIDSRELAAELEHLIEIDREHSAYLVRRTADGGCCEWVTPKGDRQRVLLTEPDSTWWMRFIFTLVEPLTPEDHL
jgi:putative cardiolipin synthase